ncbi:MULTISPECIES: antibiotic biosynthesis monooxygenase family protein [unclassified Geodermatophilus]
MYLRIWQFDVLPAAVDRFVAAYGPDGDWARLFARAEGYAGTELFRSAEGGTRFVTVDRWRDEPAWAAFLEREGEDYRALDERLAALTVAELPLCEGTAPG